MTQQEKIAFAKNYIKNPDYNNFFIKIYPFTTENISGYLNEFILENKSLLTVGSSSDQVLNAYMLGCSDITLLDINPFIKEFFYLKKSAIEELDYKDFFKFMSMQGFFFENSKAYNKKVFKKILNKMKDDSSKIFWETLLETEKIGKIKRFLFHSDTPKLLEIKNYNKYLTSEENYNKLKSRISNLKPTFLIKDIYKYHLNKNYDNIFLSNIADYNNVFDTFELFEKLKTKLNIDGKILISYLYQTDKHSNYNENYSKIYNLKNTLRIFEGAELKTFIGVENFKYCCEGELNDSILIYQKKK